MGFLVNKFPNQKMFTSKANITTTLNEISGGPDRSKFWGISRNVNEASVLFPQAWVVMNVLILAEKVSL